MEYIKSLAMAICGAVLLSAGTETILPKGEIKKYVRLVLGIIISLIILSPLGKIVSDGYLPYFHIDVPAEREAFLDMSDMEDTQKEQVLKLYTKKIEDKILESFENKYGDIDVCVEIRQEEEHFGEIEKVLILPQNEVSDSEISEIKKAVKVSTGVSEEIITVEL